MKRHTAAQSAGVATAAAFAGSAAFVLNSPSRNVHGLESTRMLKHTTILADTSTRQATRGDYASSAAIGVAAASAFAVCNASGAHRRLRIGSTARTARQQGESQLETGVTNMTLPGDFGFDPLGIANNQYIDEVCANFGLSFDRMRWYREAELMHGRVAMAATLNLMLRETTATGLLPNQLLELGAISQFAQGFALIEAFRGWRLLFEQDKIVGDLGLGGGLSEDMSQEEHARQLAEKQSRELQNGRLAMMAFAGMAAQYAVTGRAVGVNYSAIADLQIAVGNAMLPERDWNWMPVFGLMVALDGVRRLGETASKEVNPIAQKAINASKLQFGVQDPQIPLPAGVVAGHPPRAWTITPEQVRQFEEDGVIMIPGALKEWVGFLRAATDYQIDNPHVWSLVGRMSGLYDYIQRNMWMTNNSFRDFFYYSPLGSIVAQLGQTEEVRVSTDMLLVNPNKGFGWHQDNQNGPIEFSDAIRWWVAMDRCGQDDYGAPEYLLGSHRNQSVSDEAVFVDRKFGDLGNFSRSTKFVPEPGDLIIWNSRTIHRIVAPPGQQWEAGTQRRAFGGTIAKGGTLYKNKGGASGISDLAGHEQQTGDLLGGPYFPRIYPNRDPEEEAYRASGKIVGRSPQKIAELGLTLAANAGKYVSFTKVVGKKS